VADLRHPSEGLSNETLIVTSTTGRRRVVRLPPAVATFPDHDFLQQADVMELAGRSGVPVPHPVERVRDESFVGAPFLVMPFVVGVNPGPASVFDPWLTDASPEQQARTQDAMADVLATIHRIDGRESGASLGLRGAGGATLRDEVAWWRGFLDWATDGSPHTRFAALLDWCDATCPEPTAPPSLLWGDPRLGNLVFGPGRRVVAVLDWEMATVGPAELDLGWYVGLERVLRELTGGLRVPGFVDDETFVDRYAAVLGRPVEHLDWHAAFAVVRSLCINVRQAAISAEAGVDYVLPGDETNPLLGVVERWIGA
jgi:aminoglycoside phosphotransferase (APT) family kinase protein